METMFSGLIELIKAPIRHDRGIKTDNSILLVYPPDRELDFREHLLDTFVPALFLLLDGVAYRIPKPQYLRLHLEPLSQHL